MFGAFTAIPRNQANTYPWLVKEPIKINWYRTKIDKKVFSQLVKSSDLRAGIQVGLQLVLYFFTATLAFLAFHQIQRDNWVWTLPLAALALFIHGTFSSFLGPAGAVHELSHRTAFRTKVLNDVFVRIYSFLSWSDPIGFRASHSKHHQFTVHQDYDGEVILPQKFDFYSVWFIATQSLIDPIRVYNKVVDFVYLAFGRIRNPWIDEVLPQKDDVLRTEHCRWARTVLIGHLALATVFIVMGYWYLILIFTFGAYWSSWLVTLCGTPQHIGMAPNVSDFRLSCRTYTCGRFIGFLYWNMQYHVEHHMFPAVPFYNLPELRQAIQHDLPAVPHGLWATWREIIPIVIRQQTDPHYVFKPTLFNV